MKLQTQVIDKYISAFFVPVVFNPRGDQVMRREFDPFLSESEAWKFIDTTLEKEPEGSFGTVETNPAKRIKIVVPAESGLVVPDEQGIIKAH